MSSSGETWKFRKSFYPVSHEKENFKIILHDSIPTSTDRMFECTVYGFSYALYHFSKDIHKGMFDDVHFGTDSPEELYRYIAFLLSRGYEHVYICANYICKPPPLDRMRFLVNYSDEIPEKVDVDVQKWQTTVHIPEHLLPLRKKICASFIMKMPDDPPVFYCDVDLRNVWNFLLTVADILVEMFRRDDIRVYKKKRISQNTPVEWKEKSVVELNIPLDEFDKIRRLPFVAEITETT